MSGVDFSRVARRLNNWRRAGHQPVRVWLTPDDAAALRVAAYDLGLKQALNHRILRIGGVPITLMSVTPSRVVFADGLAVSWDTVCS